MGDQLPTSDKAAILAYRFAALSTFASASSRSMTSTAISGQRFGIPLPVVQLERRTTTSALNAWRALTGRSSRRGRWSRARRCSRTSSCRITHIHMTPTAASAAWRIGSAGSARRRGRADTRHISIRWLARRGKSTSCWRPWLHPRRRARRSSSSTAIMDRASESRTL